MTTRCRILLLALAVSGCGHPLATVKTIPAHYTASGAATSTEKILAAEKIQASDPGGAIGEYLAAADSASRQLRSHPTDAVALRDYNFALTRCFSVIRDAKIDA